MGEDPEKVLFVGRSCGVGQIPELLLQYKLILDFHANYLEDKSSTLFILASCFENMSQLSRCVSSSIYMQSSENLHATSEDTAKGGTLGFHDIELESHDWPKKVK